MTLTFLRGTMFNNNKSIELSILLPISSLAAMVFMLIITMLIRENSSPLVMSTVIIFFATALPAFIWSSYSKVINPIREIKTNLTSIRKEDYNLSTIKFFSKGTYSELVTELSALQGTLQNAKDRYNKDFYLLYQLVSQLKEPVLIFGPQNRLNHANSAFQKWFGKNWTMAIGADADELGFCLSDDKKWSFKDKLESKTWQIKESHFFEESERFTLIILNNIETEVRTTEQAAWHQMVRVMSHEIKNSLTPIKSLTQSLLNKKDISNNNKQALEVIHDRSKYLQEFIKNYANHTQTIKLNKSLVSSTELINNLEVLMNAPRLSVELEEFQFHVDRSLLEQVLINLVKNAIESVEQQVKTLKLNKCEQTLNIILKMKKNEVRNKVIIEVIDDGIGISNPEDLFVPFYTTKKEGQGIGLYFCREIVEKHRGSLHIDSREQGGAIATIQLPI